jgi:hypothetical protein
MNWNIFLDLLYPSDGVSKYELEYNYLNFLIERGIKKESPANTPLLNLLKSLTSPPEVYWYPGCGQDFCPLLFDTPNNPLGFRLMRVENHQTEKADCIRLNESDKKPVILWMNDYLDTYTDFPNRRHLGQIIPYSYSRLWDLFKAEAIFGMHLESYVFPNSLLAQFNDEISNYIDDENIFEKLSNLSLQSKMDAERLIRSQRNNRPLGFDGSRFGKDISIKLFTVTVKNRVDGMYQRHANGDEYLVCFSSCEAENLLDSVFIPLQMKIRAVALMRQGGLSCQRGDFGMYTSLPEKMEQLADVVGPVDFWLVDRHTYGDNGLPQAPSLKNRQPHGGSVNWGYGHARAFIR